MNKTSITLPGDAIFERLHHGNLWERCDWGDWETPDAATGLHGAVRFCAPQPGDAYLIEQVGARFGFGTTDNDDAADWAAVEKLVRSHTEITDDMLAGTFGPHWEQIVALVCRAAVLTPDEAQRRVAVLAAMNAATESDEMHAAQDVWNQYLSDSCGDQ